MSRREKAITGAQLKAMLRPGLGGAVDDGDARHPVHSHMVSACGTWLNEQLGWGKRGLVWATGTGCWTGRGPKGTPGVPDLVGWRVTEYFSDAERLTVAQLLAVECKVLPDKLNDAQAEFRELAEAANVLYFCVYWSGEAGDDPAGGLREQWGDAQ